MHLGTSRWSYPLFAAAACLVALSLPSIVGRTASTPFFLTVAAATAALAGYLLGAREDGLRALAMLDPLTGLPNRRSVESTLKHEVARAHREGTPLAVVLIELDELREINDRHGHPAGDRALAAVADALKHGCRPTDLVARWGGDEFVVVAPCTTESDAHALAERIASTVHLRSAARRPVVELGEQLKPPVLSISAGVCDADVTHPNALRPDALIATAERALIAAKGAGKGNVRSATAEARTARPRGTLKLVASRGS
ncbi:MAG: GGDEF domain-containing protein [Myxococcaceae bacterium]|nr:GGDEF domain-containing protein [Myxococcaceae bacterium]